MLVIKWPEFLKNSFPLGEKPSSMTVGVFDGVHRGHQLLLNRVVSYNANNRPVVVTFRQNHKTVNNSIITFQERLALFESLGVQITIVIDFTEEFRRMKGSEFLRLLLKYGNVGFFAVGSDFHCGYKLDTDAAAIHNFFVSHEVSIEVVPQVMEGSLPISSSRIRCAIAAGEFKLAQAMLGRDINFFAC
jgi:riboflavin kinase/FMN adenylyltransferase